MVAEGPFARLWRTWQSLRKMESQAPEMLRAAAAKRAAEEEMIARRTEASEKLVNDVTRGVTARFVKLQDDQVKEAEVRLERVHAALNNIKLDKTQIEKVAVNRLLDKFESSLGGDGSSGGNGKAPKK